MTTTPPIRRLPGIAVIALGGYAPDTDAFARGLAALRSQGCEVTSFYRHEDRHQRFGATVQGALAQLDAALADPAIDIVMALRGGYGMSRLLPLIDWDRVAASGKLFVGHSDFTAFQLALLQQTGAVSFAGPMICDDFTRLPLSGFTLDEFQRCLNGPVHVVEGKGEENGEGAIDVSGTLWGGNLAMINHLVGTPYLPSIEGGILFVEDINEHPYRVERMLLQLHHAGILARQQALVLGDFSAYRLSDYDNGYSFDAMLAYLRSVLPLPIVTGLRFGHIADKTTLAVGAGARLRGSEAGWRLEMAGYPALPDDRRLRLSGG